MPESGGQVGGGEPTVGQDIQVAAASPSKREPEPRKQHNCNIQRHKMMLLKYRNDILQVENESPHKRSIHHRAQEFSDAGQPEPEASM